MGPGEGVQYVVRLAWTQELRDRRWPTPCPHSTASATTASSDDAPIRLSDGYTRTSRCRRVRRRFGGRGEGLTGQPRNTGERHASRTVEAFSVRHEKGLQRAAFQE